MHVVTSREAIMQACRSIVAEKGLGALNMRTAAARAHVALGTLYNYYADKNELLLATVESIWESIFQLEPGCAAGAPFPDYVARLYADIRRGAAAYPDFITAHSVSIAKSKKGEARSAMAQYFARMKADMLSALQGDRLADAAFSPSFTPSDLVDFVLDNMLLLLMQGRADCVPLVELIRRVIYR